MWNDLIHKIEEFLSGSGPAIAAVRILIFYFLLHLPAFSLYPFLEFLGDSPITKTWLFSIFIIYACVHYYFSLIRRIPSFVSYIEAHDELKFTILGYWLYWFIKFIGMVLLLQVIIPLIESGPISIEILTDEHHFLNNNRFFIEVLNGLLAFITLTILAFIAIKSRKPRST